LIKYILEQVLYEEQNINQLINDISIVNSVVEYFHSYKNSKSKDSKSLKNKLDKKFGEELSTQILTYFGDVEKDDYETVFSQWQYQQKKLFKEKDVKKLMRSNAFKRFFYDKKIVNKIINLIHYAADGDVQSSQRIHKDLEELVKDKEALHKLIYAFGSTKDFKLEDLLKMWKNHIKTI
jgi:hypothetical protein